MEKSKISVIIPVYKVEKYLNRCVESVINQTYKNIEIILVDDGSPDNCPKICDEWAKKDKRIKVIHKENGGVSSARNEGLKIASGEFVQFVDSDDYIQTTFCENLVKATMSDVDLVISGFTIINEENHRIEKKFSAGDITSLKQDINLFFELLNANVLYSPVNKLYRKDSIKQNFQEGVHIGEDIIFVLDYLMVAKNKIISIEDTGYIYEQNMQSATHQTRDDLFDCYLSYLDKLKTFLKKLFNVCDSQLYFKECFKIITESIFKSSKKNIKILKNQMFKNEFFLECINNYKPNGLKGKLKLFLVKHKMFKSIRFISKIKNA